MEITKKNKSQRFMGQVLKGGGAVLGTGVFVFVKAPVD